MEILTKIDNSINRFISLTFNEILSADSFNFKQPSSKTVSVNNRLNRISHAITPFKEQFDNKCLFSSPLPLYNGGNNCYINSSMQSLLPTLNKDLVNALRSARNVSTPAIELFNAYIDQLEKRPSGWSVVNNIKNLKYISKNFRNGSQEDAQEFLNGFLDRLKEEFEKIDRFKGKNNPISKNYVSSYDSRYYCTKCGESNIKSPLIQDELTFFVEVGDNIPSMLNSAYTTNINNYFCETCKIKKGSAKMKSVFTSLPRTFICSIKRFKHNQFNGSKLFQEVALTRHINLPFLDSYNRRQMMTYELSSIVIHLGSSINSGHYECITRLGEKWYRISDSNVMNINEAIAKSSSKCNSYIYTYTQCHKDNIAAPLKRKHSLDQVPSSKHKKAKLKKLNSWKPFIGEVLRQQSTHSSLNNMSSKAVVCLNS